MTTQKLFRMFIVAAGILVPSLITSPLLALTLTVTGAGDTTANDGVCTLREAIGAFNTQFASGDASGECGQGASFDATNDTVAFDSSIGPKITLTGGTITLSGGLGPSVITSSITVQGPGSGLLTIDGNGGGRIFTVDDECSICGTFVDFTAVIKGVTITNGAGVEVIDYDCNSALVLDHVVVTGNTKATDEGGGVRAINGCPLTVTNSSISHNSTTGSGGGIAMMGGGNKRSIANTTVAANVAKGDGGGIFNAGGSSLAIEDSTIFGNIAFDPSSDGGGLYNGGAFSSVSATNSTFSGNQSNNDGGGIQNAGDGSNTVALLNDTVFDNIADDPGGGSGDGGGISQADGAGEFTVTNTIVAGNHDNSGKLLPGPVVNDCSTATDDASDVVSGGNNLIGDVAGCGDNTFDASAAKKDLMGDSTRSGAIDPMLAAMDPIDGGDPAAGALTGIHVPLSGSPAIDAVDAAVASAPSDDQHGASRPVGAAAEIGAVEVYCGDGVIQGNEACDDGFSNSDKNPDACRIACVKPGCGDGVVDTDEECDDGNSEDADACKNDCTVPTGGTSGGTTAGGSTGGTTAGTTGSSTDDSKGEGGCTLIR